MADNFKKFYIRNMLIRAKWGTLFAIPFLFILQPEAIRSNPWWIIVLVGLSISIHAVHFYLKRTNQL